MLHAHWVAIRCDVSGVSEATAAVAEATEATCIHERICNNKEYWHVHYLEWQ